jgi:anti-sigma regulatory factor (Ser/Thr protein kinase)
VELEFSGGTLSDVRATAARMAQASMTRDRAIDVMLAVHELAANAVVHGGGRGRLRMHVTAGSLYCEVDDAGRTGLNGRPANAAPSPAHDHRVPWPVEPGHGLWLVARACDELTVASGPDGSCVTAMFVLPATRGRSSPGQ